MPINGELLGYQGLSTPFFNDLQERYGPALEGIHIDDKLVILSSIPAYHLIGEGATMEDAWQLYDPDDDSNPVAFEILNELEELEPDRQFAFALALLNQVRESYRLHGQFTEQLINAGVEEELAEEVAGVIAAGGDRTDEQIALVSKAWGRIVEADPQLAHRIEAIMTAR